MWLITPRHNHTETLPWRDRQLLGMSALGHEQTSRHVRVVSVIPLKADIHQRGLHVRLVPLADMRAWAPQFGLELAELG
jgi:hypothetical protein